MPKYLHQNSSDGIFPSCPVSGAAADKRYAPWSRDRSPYLRCTTTTGLAYCHNFHIFGPACEEQLATGHVNQSAARFQSVPSASPGLAGEEARTASSSLPTRHLAPATASFSAVGCTHASPHPPPLLSVSPSLSQALLPVSPTPSLPPPPALTTARWRPPRRP